MLARQLVELCDTGEPSIVQKLYGISTRQAQALEVSARRLVRQGAGNQELTAERSLSRSQGLREHQEHQEHQEPVDDLEEEAQARARRIKAESAGVAGASIAQLHSRLAVLERNVRAGYGAEWSHDLCLTKRILELSEGVTA